MKEICSKDCAERIIIDMYQSSTKNCFETSPFGAKITRATSLENYRAHLEDFQTLLLQKIVVGLLKLGTMGK